MWRPTEGLTVQTLGLSSAPRAPLPWRQRRPVDSIPPSGSNRTTEHPQANAYPRCHSRGHGKEKFARDLSQFGARLSSIRTCAPLSRWGLCGVSGCEQSFGTMRGGLEVGTCCPAGTATKAAVSTAPVTDIRLYPPSTSMLFPSCLSSADSCTAQSNCLLQVLPKISSS